MGSVRYVEVTSMGEYQVGEVNFNGKCQVAGGDSKGEYL